MHYPKQSSAVLDDPSIQQPPTKHLDQEQLARRWCLSPRTLERWRWLKQGPSYLRLGGRIAYRLTDVEAFEAAELRTTTAKPAQRPTDRD